MVAMEMTQLKDMLVRVRARRRRGAMLIQELAKEEAKLRNHLSATSASLTSYLDNLQQVADCAKLSEGESKAMGDCLVHVVDWQRKLQEELAKMLKGWVVKDYVAGNVDTKEEKRSKVICCLGRKSNKKGEAEKDEVMLRVLVKKALEQERLLYQDLTLGIKERIQGGSFILQALSGAEEADEVLGKASQPKVLTKEPLSMIRRTSLSSMASFSYSPGARWSSKSDSEDSGVLSELAASTPTSDGRTQMQQSNSVCQMKSAPRDDEVGGVRYSTVRRSPSPCYSPVRSPSPTLHSIQPPTIKDVSFASGTLDRERTASQRPCRPPTQRCGGQAGPWGRSLSNSSLFPQPCSSQTSVEEPVSNGATTTDKRREKRRRNLTQAVSLSSLRSEVAPEFDEGHDKKTSVDIHDSTSNAGNQSPREVDIANGDQWGPSTPLKEIIEGSTDIIWTTPRHVKENFPDSPTTLPPPPSFLLDPAQAFHGRNPNLYGIFEP